MLRLLDNFLNHITMYRVVLYNLLGLAGVSIVMSLGGLIYFPVEQLVLSLVVLIPTCYFSNKVFGKLLNIPTNIESPFITAMILFFLLLPIGKPLDAYTAFFAGVLAMASKYIFALHEKHIFNPAAISVFILGLVGNGNVLWWVGSDVLLPFVTVGGLLIVRKIRRFTLFFSFLIPALIMITLFGLRYEVPIQESLSNAFKSWPLMFFATVMLTEPLTMPPTRKLQIIFGVLVGVLFGVQFEFGPLYSTPEFALIVGNVFAYIVSPKVRMRLRLQEKRLIADGIYEFIFQPSRQFAFEPGQYLEWTLPHNNPDARGNRRYFTIASAPTEANVKLGVRVEERSSSFKRKLVSMGEHDAIVGAQLTGDFTLPRNQHEKLVFIAGGIGVTPFRSMVQYLMDCGEKRDIVMFYVNKKEGDIAYKEVFDRAAKSLNLKTIYTLTDKENLPKHWKGQVGRVDDAMIQLHVPDYRERKFYLSGPNVMVDAHKAQLARLGIAKQNIITDYFPGF